MTSPVPRFLAPSVFIFYWLGLALVYMIAVDIPNRSADLMKELWVGNLHTIAYHIYGHILTTLGHGDYANIASHRFLAYMEAAIGVFTPYSAGGQLPSRPAAGDKVRRPGEEEHLAGASSSQRARRQYICRSYPSRFVAKMSTERSGAQSGQWRRTAHPHPYLSRTQPVRARLYPAEHAWLGGSGNAVIAIEVLHARRRCEATRRARARARARAFVPNANPFAINQKAGIYPGRFDPEPGERTAPHWPPTLGTCPAPRWPQPAEAVGRAWPPTAHPGCRAIAVRVATRTDAAVTGRSRLCYRPAPRQRLGATSIHPSIAAVRCTLFPDTADPLIPPLWGPWTERHAPWSDFVQALEAESLSELPPPGGLPRGTPLEPAARKSSPARTPGAMRRYT